MTIVGEEGKVEWNNLRDVAKIYTQGGSVVEPVSASSDFSRNTLFLEELREFLAAIQENRAPAVTLEDGVQALEITLAIHESSETRSEVILADSLFPNTVIA